ncbi:MAG: hypothetical protein H0U92_08385 [Actinobacteria bacterium]|nr:hypothetical protein [Actinomycetota bacterium]
MRATGYRPNTSAQIIFHSDPVLLATVTSDSSGVVSATVQIPANATAGSHTIEVLGTGVDGAARSQSAGFTVVAASNGVLARTGEAIGVLLLLASLLVMLGGLALFFGRPRFRYGLRK